MFKCDKCKHLEGEIEFLRSQTKSLTDRLIAISSPAVYDMLSAQPMGASYYGDGNGDVMKFYDDFGQSYLVEERK